MLKLNETMQTREERAHDFLDRLIKANAIPGIQYMVLNRVKVLFEYCGGYQDIKQALPVTPATTFMINAITKPFTAAAVLQLVEKGDIQMEARLSAYFSNHPYGPHVTIRHLLNQTSGIPHSSPVNWFHLAEEDPHFDEDKALTGVLKQSRLKHHPGSRYYDSAIAYWLLAKVVENISGRSFPDYTRRNIFKPLSIFPAEMDFIIPDVNLQAKEYRKTGFSLTNLPLSLKEDRSFKGEIENGWQSFKLVHHNGYGYGGLYARASGLRKFLQEMMKDLPVIFSPETRKNYFSPQKNNAGHWVGTTLGWDIGHLRGLDYFGKTSRGIGSHGNIRLYPDKGVATILLANSREAKEQAIHRFSNYLDMEFLQ